MSGLCVRHERPLAKVVTTPQVPPGRGGLVMPLDFPECPAIRIDLSLYLLFFRKNSDCANGAGLCELQPRMG